MKKFDANKCERCGGKAEVLQEGKSGFLAKQHQYGCTTCGLSGFSFLSALDAKQRFMQVNVEECQKWMELEKPCKCASAEK